MAVVNLQGKTLRASETDWATTQQFSEFYLDIKTKQITKLQTPDMWKSRQGP